MAKKNIKDKATWKLIDEFEEKSDDVEENQASQACLEEIERRIELNSKLGEEIITDEYYNGYSILSFACASGKTSIVEALVNKGNIDVNHLDKNGRTPNTILHYRSSIKDYEYDDPEDDNDYPESTAEKDKEIFKFLLKKGARYPISQAILLPKLQMWLDADVEEDNKKYDPAVISSIKRGFKSGQCSGLSWLHRLMANIGNQELFRKKMEEISKWDGNISGISPHTNTLIERIIQLTILAHGSLSSKLTDDLQGQFSSEIGRLLSTNMRDDETIVRTKSLKRDICSKKKFNECFKSVDLNSMVYITACIGGSPGAGHAVDAGIRKVNGKNKYWLYDPNNPAGEIEFNNFNDFWDAIKSEFSDGINPPILGMHIYDKYSPRSNLSKRKTKIIKDKLQVRLKNKISSLPHNKYEILEIKKQIDAMNKDGAKSTDIQQLERKLSEFRFNSTTGVDEVTRLLNIMNYNASELNLDKFCKKNGINKNSESYYKLRDFFDEIKVRLAKKQKNKIIVTKNKKPNFIASLRNIMKKIVLPKISVSSQSDFMNMYKTKRRTEKYVRDNSVINNKYEIKNKAKKKMNYSYAKACKNLANKELSKENKYKLYEEMRIDIFKRLDVEFRTDFDSIKIDLSIIAKELSKDPSSRKILKLFEKDLITRIDRMIQDKKGGLRYQEAIKQISKYFITSVKKSINQTSPRP